MARPANHIPTDRERGVLQSLIEGQWLLAAELHPAVPSTIFVMIGKGWIERKQYAAVSKYRITASGRAALKQVIPSKPCPRQKRVRKRLKAKGS
jgi:hypothetical protein